MELERANFGDDYDFPAGALTEAEVELNRVLQKQLNTKVTLSGQFSQHREFDVGGQLVSLPASSSGLGTASQLESLQREDDSLQRLVRAGLTSAEIELFLKSQQVPSDQTSLDLKGTPCFVSQSKFGCEPTALQRRLAHLQEKVIQRNSKVDPSNVDPSLRAVRGISEAPEEPFAYIAKFAKKLEARKTRNKKGKKRRGAAEPVETEETVLESVDPCIFHAVVPLDEKDILENRLSQEQIRQIPRFTSYAPGDPSSVLYLKNIHAKARLEELIALFGRYDTQTFRLRYRLLAGKMRGQAFITFPDSDSATAALHLLNGYQLRGQPLIIQFGRRDQKT